MDRLKASFEDVADWCERHLEDRHGREIGITFGAVLRTYGRLASLPARLREEERALEEKTLNARVEKLLSELSIRVVASLGWVAKKPQPMNPNSMCTNMIYDSGPQSQDGT